MEFHRIFKSIEKTLSDNSPAILTGLGVAGTVVTAILASRAAFKAGKKLAWEEAHRESMEEIPPLDHKERFRLTWKLYIPAVGVGAATITSIIFANRIEARRGAALAAAYAISEKAFVEYREQVVKKLGENKERAIRDESAQTQVDRDPPTMQRYILTGKGTTMCRDSFSGRYFEGDIEKIRKAQNDFNQQVLYDGRASLTDFYALLGLDKIDMSDELGWTSERILELEFTSALHEGSPILVVKFATSPVTIRHPED